MISHKPCLLIPCYNHARQFERVAAELAALNLPCLVVDDGSDAYNAAELVRLAALHPFIILERLAHNSGKGGAVQHGLRMAAQHGFTHALQVDADGQHDLQQVPALLSESRQHPSAVICGWPRYSDDAPKSRLYGRRITQFWVHIETLSFAIKDAMCGFRVYPLAAMAPLLLQRLGRRMDFDIEVLVRLSWRRVPMHFIASDVRYPENGVSHFAMLRDNARISWLHTRLVCGMLLRLPLLLWKRGQPQHWSQQGERGAYAGMWLGLQCYRLLGERFLRFLLIFVIAYFYATNATARTASRHFLQRVHALGGNLARAPDRRMTYRHLYQFGVTVLERIGAWTGEIKRSDVDFPGRALLHEQRRSGRGGVLLVAHLGNVEMCRGLIDGATDLKMNVLVFTRHAQGINRLMQQVNPRANVELIQVDAIGPDTTLRLAEKIERGEFVVIAADRTSPASPQRISDVEFLGGTASLPQGPYILASVLQCPVYMLFCLKEAGSYRLYLEHFADEVTLPRASRNTALQAHAQRFAQRLEHHALRAPLQWFNFYDFWASPRRPAVRDDKTVTHHE